MLTYKSVVRYSPGIVVQRQRKEHLNAILGSRFKLMVKTANGARPLFLLERVDVATGPELLSIEHRRVRSVIRLLIWSTV